MTVWELQIGEVLVLQREPHNPEDQLAVSVVRSGRTVGHMPSNLAPVFSQVLQQWNNRLLVRKQTVAEAMGWRCPASIISIGQGLC